MKEVFPSKLHQKWLGEKMHFCEPGCGALCGQASVRSHTCRQCAFLIHWKIHFEKAGFSQVTFPDCFAHNLLYSIHLVYKCTRELKPCNMVQKTQFILHCMLFTFFEALQKSPSSASVDDESGVGAGLSGRRRRR